MGNYCCDPEEPENRPPLLHSPTEKRKSNSDVKPSIKEVINPKKRSSKKIEHHGPDDYQSIKYLGRGNLKINVGTFGDVVLAEEKKTGKKYAMKIIDKAKIK